MASLTQRVELTDEERLIVNEDGADAPENQEWFRGCSVYYTLPSMRLSNLLICLLLIDLVLCNALWLTGKGDESYKELKRIFVCLFFNNP